MAGAGCEISGFVIVKRRARVKARPGPGPDITLLQRNIIFIRHPDIVELQSDQDDIRGKGFLQQTGCETRCYHLVIESFKGSNNIIVIWLTMVDVMRSINPRAKTKNVQDVKLVRKDWTRDLPRVSKDGF